jgi:hypothetical protein
VIGEGMKEIGGEAYDIATTIVVVITSPLFTPLIPLSTLSANKPATTGPLGDFCSLSRSVVGPPDLFAALATGRRLTQSTSRPTTEVDRLTSVVRHPERYRPRLHLARQLLRRRRRHYK